MLISEAAEQRSKGMFEKDDVQEKKIEPGTKVSSLLQTARGGQVFAGKAGSDGGALLAARGGAPFPRRPGKIFHRSFREDGFFSRSG